MSYPHSDPSEREATINEHAAASLRAAGIDAEVIYFDDDDDAREAAHVDTHDDDCPCHDQHGDIA